MQVTMIIKLSSCRVVWLTLFHMKQTNRKKIGLENCEAIQSHLSLLIITIIAIILSQDILENCLVKSMISKLQNPLTGLLFLYDPVISDKKETPVKLHTCSQNHNIKIRIFCSPTNVETIRVSSPGSCAISF